MPLLLSLLILIFASPTHGGCLQSINAHLNFDLFTVIAPPPSEQPHLRISKKNPINSLLMQDFAELTEMSNKSVDSSCIATAQALQQELRATLLKRLRHLAQEKKWDLFHEEGRLVLVKSDDPSLRTELFKLSSTYLQSIQEELFAELSGSPWRGFANLKINVQVWSKKWNQQERCNENSPAGVEIESKNIVLRPFVYSPEELKLHLFHEIAHLADPTALAPESTDFTREMYAWNETVRMIEWQMNNDHAVPNFAQSLRVSIDAIGLNTWIKERSIHACREISYIRK